MGRPRAARAHTRARQRATRGAWGPRRLRRSTRMWWRWGARRACGSSCARTWAWRRRVRGGAGACTSGHVGAGVGVLAWPCGRGRTPPAMCVCMHTCLPVCLPARAPPPRRPAARRVPGLCQLWPQQPPAQPDGQLHVHEAHQGVRAAGAKGARAAGALWEGGLQHGVLQWQQICCCRCSRTPAGGQHRALVHMHALSIALLSATAADGPARGRVLRHSKDQGRAAHGL